MKENRHPRDANQNKETNSKTWLDVLPVRDHLALRVIELRLTHMPHDAMKPRELADWGFEFAQAFVELSMGGWAIAAREGNNRPPKNHTGK